MPLCLKKKNDTNCCCIWKSLTYSHVKQMQILPLKNGFGKSLEWSLSTYPIHGYLKSKEPDVQFYCYIIIIFIHINVQFVALKCFR